MSDVQDLAANAAEDKAPKRRSAQQTLAANRRNICATSFDFLGGSFRAAARLRMASILVAGVVIALNLVIITKGLSAMSDASRLDGQVDALRRQYNQQVLEFGAITGLDADKNTEFLKRDETLGAALQFLMAQQRNLPELIDAALALPDVRVISIEFNQGDDRDSVELKAGDPVPFALTAEATDFTDIKPWIESLKDNPGITEITTSRDGKNITVVGKFKGSSPTSVTELLRRLSLLPETDATQPAQSPNSASPTTTTGGGN